MCCSAAVPEPSTRSSCQLAGVPLGKPAADGVGRAPNGFLRLPPVIPTASWGRVPTGSRCAEPVKTQGLRVGSYGFLRVPTGGRFLRFPTGWFSVVFRISACSDFARRWNTVKLSNTADALCRLPLGSARCLIESLPSLTVRCRTLPPTRSAPLALASQIAAASLALIVEHSRS